MNNLTTIISEMIENELEGILLDINNHVLDRLSNKIINEVREDERNRIFEALLSDELIQVMAGAVFDKHRVEIETNDANILWKNYPMNEVKYGYINDARTALTAVVEKIRSNNA